MRGFSRWFLLGLLGACAPREHGNPMEAEVDRVTAVNDAYRSGWLAGDSAAILRLFSSDAVLLPHHGDPPVVGLAAIREFWWPPNAPPATVKALDITTDDVEIDGSTATLWGRFALTFSFPVEGQLRSVSNSGTYLMVLRRQGNGEWLITHRMWDDPVARQH